MPFVETSGIWYADHRDPTIHRLPVLLIHGAGGTHLDWPAELRRLPEANTLAPDLPGHGRSKGSGRNSVGAYAADMVTLLDELHLPRAIILGFSMGAAVALLLALHHKARVAGLILIGAGAQISVNPAILDGLQQDFQQTVRLLIDWQWSESVGEQVKRLSMRRLMDTDPAVLLNDYRAADRFDVRDQLAQVQAPALVIGGTADRMIPFSQSTFLHEHLTGSRLVRIDGGGHMMALEQPQAIADAVQTWLMETYP
ncbi:MAG: alpha/beta hydrolase [Anaerolineae bacterium]|nr:alpha/beta hydrolase [Anaerolineae bacterium]